MVLRGFLAVCFPFLSLMLVCATLQGAARGAKGSFASSPAGCPERVPTSATPSEPPAGVVAPNAAPDSSLARVILVKTGLHSQFREFPASIREEFERYIEGQAGIPPAVGAKIVEILAGAFAEEPLVAAFASRLQADLSTSEMTAIITWHDSPLGLKITRLQESLEAPENEESFWKEAVPEPGDTRYLPYRELDELTQTSRTITDIHLNIQFAVVLALQSSRGVSDTGLCQRILEQIEQSRPLVQKNSEDLALRTLAFCFKQLTSVELDSFRAFLAGPLGQKFHRAMNRAIDAALAGCARTAGERIAEFMKERKSLERPQSPQGGKK